MVTKYESGTGPYTVFFETGSLLDGTKMAWLIRRNTLKHAKIEALEQAKIRGLVVAVHYRGREIWETRGTESAKG